MQQIGKKMRRRTGYIKFTQSSEVLRRPSEESESGKRKWSAVSNAADRASVGKSLVSLEETGRKGPINTR